jgi:integrase/recombinase XerD
VSDLLDAGVDLATVQKLCGHQDPATTSRYDRRGDAAARRAAGLLRIPQGDPVIALAAAGHAAAKET